MATLTLGELRALAAGADWIAHQEGCASITERPCSCGATELRMALLPVFDVAITARQSEQLGAQLVDLIEDFDCGDEAAEDEADALMPAVNAAYTASRESLAAALAELKKVAS